MLSQYSLLHIRALSRPRCTNTIKRERNKTKVSFLYKLIEVNDKKGPPVNMKETREKFTARCDILEKKAILNILFCRS